MLFFFLKNFLLWKVCISLNTHTKKYKWEHVFAVLYILLFKLKIYLSTLPTSAHVELFFILLWLPLILFCICTDSSLILYWMMFSLQSSGYSKSCICLCTRVWEAIQSGATYLPKSYGSVIHTTDPGSGILWGCAVCCLQGCPQWLWLRYFPRNMKC